MVLGFITVNTNFPHQVPNFCTPSQPPGSKFILLHNGCDHPIAGSIFVVQDGMERCLVNIPDVVFFRTCIIFPGGRCQVCRTYFNRNSLFMACIQCVRWIFYSKIPVYFPLLRIIASVDPSITLSACFNRSHMRSPQLW